jgi:DNA helicase-2/ATP-dependent DNA helicase PcrA
MKIEIKDKHIIEAEQLFIGGSTFDKKERIPFIKNLETCDLLAVPGSGKTTALMAKLYCLSKQLPFEDGSGILVLAHTNATVDEIENELKKHCPNLFEYPNFIGTVQAFINTFLTIPYYQNKNRRIINKIDTTIYNNQLKNTVINTFMATKQVKKLFRTPKIDWIYNFEINEYEEGKFNITDRETKIKIDIKNPVGNTKKENYKDWSDSEKQSIINNLINLKSRLLSDGLLSFEDCYFYANKYSEKLPQIKNIIQHRFKYIFVDEMQDLEKYQIDIIDEIFFEENSKSVIQRIGDINQSIYNSSKKVKIECDWKTRREMYLNDSNRLTKSISDLVDGFTLDKKIDKFNVRGKRILENGDIKPHLVLFKKDTGEALKSKFDEIIKSFALHKLPEIKNKKNEKEKFKIIGWNGEWKPDEESKGKLRLKDVFPQYSKESKSIKDDFENLSKYLQLFNSEKTTLEAVRKSILNAFINILRIEDIKISKKIRNNISMRYYTKSDFIEFIKNKNEESYEEFKQTLFGWCFQLVSDKNYECVYKSVKQFINTVLKEWFNLELKKQETINFIGLDFELFEKNNLKNNICIKNEELNIDIATVHSVKGQTHCATMYVETSYFDYETKKTKIRDVLLKKNHNFIIGEKNKGTKTKPGGEKDARGKQALKMMYVGFSRPTHLLCFAVLEENVKDDLDKFENAGWKIDYDLVTIDSKSQNVHQS